MGAVFHMEREEIPDAPPKNESVSSYKVYRKNIVWVPYPGYVLHFEFFKSQN